MRAFVTTSLLLLVAGCNKDKGDQNLDLLDTGWFIDTASLDPDTCPHRIVEIKPEARTDDWYWHKAPRIWTETRREDSYGARLFDAEGREVPVTLVWDDVGNFFDVRFRGGLTPLGSYSMQVTDCSGTTERDFSVSAVGLPLTDGPSMLQDRTYQIDMVNGDWIQPAGMGGLITLYFTVPVLLGVERSTDDGLDLLGAVGAEIGGVMVQDINEPTWDFPIVSFKQAPYFVAESETVVFKFQWVDVPVTNFRLAATFSPDGTRIVGGEISGLTDTRNMGQLFGDPDNKNAVCDIGASLGVGCEPCPDGKKYCMTMSVRDVVGTQVPLLKLQEQK